MGIKNSHCEYAIYLTCSSVRLVLTCSGCTSRLGSYSCLNALETVKGSCFLYSYNLGGKLVNYSGVLESGFSSGLVFHLRLQVVSPVNQVLTCLESCLSVSLSKQILRSHSVYISSITYLNYSISNLNINIFIFSKFLKNTCI